MDVIRPIIESTAKLVVPTGRVLYGSQSREKTDPLDQLGAVVLKIYIFSYHFISISDIISQLGIYDMDMFFTEDMKI